MVDLAVTIAAALFLGAVGLVVLGLIGSVLWALWDAMVHPAKKDPPPERPGWWEERQ